jgi:hypothetical protein
MASEVAFDVWVELVCHGCASTVSGQHTYGRIPRGVMRKEAESEGWKQIGLNWYCKFCAAKSAPPVEEEKMR